MKGVSNVNLFTIKGKKITFILLRGFITFELIKLVTFASPPPLFKPERGIL